ncbi:MAG TPA: ArsR family transcriptional regulator [Bacteroidales bacterium]|nr:ArsR family transcriptional regulator [Bacteroidales bacterium]
MGGKEKVYSKKQEKLARYSKALSHPARIYILDFIASSKSMSCYSSELAENLTIARSTLSQHLTELKTAGLIYGEPDPPFIRYCIDREAWDEARKMYKAFLGR